MNITDLRQADYNISAQFINRWSPRSFLEKEIPDDVLMRLFEAARWAPSANNLQPWRFIVARTKEDKEIFYSFIRPSNLVWCKKAPVLAMIVSEKVSERGDNKWHAFDTGAAWGFLALEAHNQGLVTHAIGGLDAEKAREVLHIPMEYEVQAVIAIGYQGDKAALPPELQEREQPNQRRPLQESIFEGVFGKQSDVKL